MPIPIVYLITVFLVCTGYVLVGGKKKKVFISYHSKGDSHNKNLIMAWVKSNNLKLDFEDLSTDTNINSKDTKYLRRRMRSRIEESDYFIVFIGQDTHERDWVNWEIEVAKSMNKKIIAIKEKRTYKSPTPLLGSGAKWVYGFSEEGIRVALESF